MTAKDERIEWLAYHLYVRIGFLPLAGPWVGDTIQQWQHDRESVRERFRRKVSK